MARAYQLTIDGIVWCGAYRITPLGGVEFQGFPHPDYDLEELTDLLRKLRGENE